MSEDYTDISAVELSDSMWPLRWFHYDYAEDGVKPGNLRMAWSAVAC